jgi:type IV pilus assembly protein PilQ
MEEFRVSPEDVKVKTLQLEPPQEVSDPEEEISKLPNDSPSEQPDVKPSAERNVDEILEAELKKLEAASELTGPTDAIEDNNDKLFSELLDSLAEAEAKLARQSEPPSEISEAMEDLLTVGEPNEPGADFTSESETQAEPNDIAVFPQPTTPSEPNVIPSQARQEFPETAEESNIPLVTNMFYDISLREVLSDISAQTGVIIVPDMTVTGMVTCELQEVPLEEALETVLAGSDYVVKEMDGYYQVGSADAKDPNLSTLSVTRTVKLNYLSAEDAKALLPETFANYVQVDKSGNEVCVTALPAVAEKIVRRLKDTDKPPRQVMLDARVVELNADAKDKLGVDWSWARHGHSPGLDIRRDDAAFNKTSATIEIGYVPTAELTNNLMQILASLFEDKSAKIMANPRVTAIDGKQAKIEIATEEYFKVTNGPARDAYASLETIKSGIMLQMTPRIGAGGEITLEVSPEVSDVVGVGAEGLPRVARRKVSTTVRVKNGGTVVIGGLVNKTKQETSNKVPVLGDVPVLGSLFKGTTSTQTTGDVVIFITPRLLGEDGRPEQITNTMVDGPEPEPIEPADEELEKGLLEVLDP